MKKVEKNDEKQLISLKNVVNDAKNYEKVEIYTLKNGQDMQFHPYFSRNKLIEIVNEYKSYAFSEDKDDKAFMEMVTKDDLNVTLFWYFLAIKKFTHFGEQMKEAKQVKDLIVYYDALLETGLLEEIANDVFEYEELRKISEIFVKETALIVASNETTEHFAKELVEVKEKFEKAVKEK